MPIHLDISDLDRLVIAVVLGEATADDIVEVAREFLKTGRQALRQTGEPELF